MMFGALLFGTIADKIGRKKVILICISIFSLFMLLAGFANGPELFVLCRFITGLGLGGVMPNVIALISDYSRKGTRSRMIATIMAGFSIWGGSCRYAQHSYYPELWLAIRILLVVVASAGATTIGSQNLANSYISQYYPSTVRSTGFRWALGIGRIGGIPGYSYSLNREE